MIPCAHQQRLDAGHGRLHRLGDLLVGQRLHLAQDERRALRLGKVADISDQRPEVLTVVDLVRGRRTEVGKVDVHRVDADRMDLAHVVAAAVPAIR